jgi:CheY-like chemotaxis protein
LATPSEILVVDDAVASVAGLLGVLRTPGYKCTSAFDFPDALALVRTSPYDLLIVGIPLEDEIGLGFVRAARDAQPDLAIIVINDSIELAPAQELLRLDAVLIRLPDDLLRLSEILKTGIPRGRTPRKWNRKRVAGGFGAKIGNASARVVDVSYGGFRLEMSVPPAPSQAIDMNLLPFGFVVNAQLIWVNRSDPAGPWNCGAALSALDPAIERAWRVVVDALPDSTQH